MKWGRVLIYISFLCGVESLVTYVTLLVVGWPYHPPGRRQCWAYAGTYVGTCRRNVGAESVRGFVNLRVTCIKLLRFIKHACFACAYSICETFIHSFIYLFGFENLVARSFSCSSRSTLSRTKCSYLWLSHMYSTLSCISSLACNSLQSEDALRAAYQALFWNLFIIWIIERRSSCYCARILCFHIPLSFSVNSLVYKSLTSLPHTVITLFHATPSQGYPTLSHIQQ